MSGLIKNAALIVLAALLVVVSFVILNIKAELDVAEKKLSTIPEFYGQVPGNAIAKVVPGNDYIAIDPNLTISSLVNGSYVVMMRHTLRDNLNGEVLWRADREGECIKGSSLSDKGKRQAEAISAKLTELSIPVQEVIASPTCRTRQHAEIGFGAYTKLSKDIWYQPMMKVGEKTLADVGLLEMISAPISGPGNRFIIGHNNTIERLGIVGVPAKKLEQGDSAVFRPMGKNKFKYLGTIPITAWTE